MQFDKVYSSQAEPINWITKKAKITDENGKIKFEMDVEAPDFWSDTAVSIVANKYFKVIDGVQESSVKHLVDRVVNTITDWGVKDHYFSATESIQYRTHLSNILLSQTASFNSPVYFNVGAVPNPQVSACFIVNVNDSMNSILNWYTTEGKIFQNGSGSGINISSLRAEGELLSGGGTASGPLSFMKAADESAGAIKSGGRTRRAACMRVMNVDHPDIYKFIECKVHEEKLARILLEAGWSDSMDGPIYQALHYQNANNSVRVSDEFMQAVESDKDWQLKRITDGTVTKTLKAKELFSSIAKAAWECADPGIQFDTTINKWHTRPNSGRIAASNPCAEFYSLDNSACNLASLNLLKFVENDNFNIDRFIFVVQLMIQAMDSLIDNSSFPTELIAKNTIDNRELGLGYANLGALLMYWGLPYDSDEGRELAAAITSLLSSAAYVQSALLAKEKGAYSNFELNREAHLDVVRMHAFHASKLATSENKLAKTIAAKANDLWSIALSFGAEFGYRNSQTTVLAPTGTIAFMMDCFTADTMVAVADGRNAVSFKDLAEEGKDVEVYGSLNGKTVVRMMRNIGMIRSGDRIVRVNLDDGTYFRCTPDHLILLRNGTYKRADNLTVNDSLMRFDSVVKIAEYDKPRRCIWMGPESGGNRNRGNYWAPQYRLTGSRLYPGYNGRSGGLIHHGDSDSLNDRYDNLELLSGVSEHLVEHWRDLSFEERSAIIKNRWASRSIEDRKESARKTHEAQTPEQRKARARKAVEAHSSEDRSEWTKKGWSGISKEERKARAKKSWETRRKLAENASNNESIQVNNHKVVSVVDDGIADVYCGEVDEIKNFAIITSGYEDTRSGDLSGVVVHNCDTTGIEPDIAPVKFKKLVGGGRLNIVNQTVPPALKRLGYSSTEIKELLTYVEQYETFVGSKLKSEHLPIFDCANGVRSISPIGHVKMMAAVQPFLSGGISKSVNLPNSATVEDIENIYLQAWKLGVKSIAVYRDGSKWTQPLNGTKFVEKKLATVTTLPIRKRLPEDRPSNTHKMEIAQWEGYIHSGVYEDGSLAELFIKGSKQGSTVSGLLDGIGIVTSIALQHGVPLQVIADKLIDMRFEPSGITKNSKIRFANSILDYTFRHLMEKYGNNSNNLNLSSGYTNGSNGHNNGNGKTITPLISSSVDGLESVTVMESTVISVISEQTCNKCEGIMIRTGTCMVCRSCGTSSGGCA